jgi:arabinofuranan 3-O-arabinosyltransferase
MWVLWHHPAVDYLRRRRLLVFPQVWNFFRHIVSRYVLAWLVAGATLALFLHIAWTSWDSRAADAHSRRRDGNEGHTRIDFGGQWLMGRLLARGYGRQLYNRNYQRQVLEEAYPRRDEAPAQETSDAETLMHWLLGTDSGVAPVTVGSCVSPLAAGDPLGAAALLAAGQRAWTPERLREVEAPRVGGAMYPPVHAFVCYPLALLPPQPAYRAQQLAAVVLTLLAGLAVRQLSQGRIWWPVAVTLLALFPGYLGSLALGQNALLTLTVLLWGWVLIARGRPGWGGAVWGLLAFKPVWALAFFLVPLLTRRWRTCLAMLATGAALALATLPFVGWQCWLDWWTVGGQGARLYYINRDVIEFSRDLLGLPRRWLADPRQGFLLPGFGVASALGWGLLGGVVVLTTRLAVLRREQARAVTGPVAGFLLLGAWLSCFHFMYYDVLLAALPVCALLAEPHPYHQRRGFTVVLVVVVLLSSAYLNVLVFFGQWSSLPWETFSLMAVWLWCGWLWLRQRKGGEPGACQPSCELRPLDEEGPRACMRQGKNLAVREGSVPLPLRRRAATLRRGWYPEGEARQRSILAPATAVTVRYAHADRSMLSAAPGWA